MFSQNGGILQHLVFVLLKRINQIRLGGPAVEVDDGHCLNRGSCKIITHEMLLEFNAFVADYLHDYCSCHCDYE